MELTLPTTAPAAAHQARCAPFPAEDIGLVPLGRSGLVALYPVLDAVQDRLSTVDGPLGWEFRSRQLDDLTVVGALTIQGILRESIGFGANAAAREAAALKRAAARHGIGRYIARTRRIEVPIGTGTLDLHERPGGKLIIDAELDQALRDDYAARCLPALRDRYGAPLARAASSWQAPPLDAAADDEQWAATLAAPFATAAIRWVIVERDLDHEHPYAIVAPYVPRVTYEDRLDAAAGPANWSCAIVEVAASSVTVAVTINDATRHGIGEGASRYEQEAHAFKRACKQHGVGRYLARRDLGMRQTLGVTNTPEGILIEGGQRLRIGAAAQARLGAHYANALTARITPHYGPVLDHHDALDQMGDSGEVGPDADDAFRGGSLVIDPAAITAAARTSGQAAARFGLVEGGRAGSQPAPSHAARPDPRLRLAAAPEPPAEAPSRPGQPTGATARDAQPQPAQDAPETAPANEHADQPPDQGKDARERSQPPETLAELAAPTVVLEALASVGVADPLAARTLRMLWCVPDGPLEFSAPRIASLQTVVRTLQEATLDASDVAALLDVADQAAGDAKARCTEFCAALLRRAQERENEQQQAARPDQLEGITNPDAEQAPPEPAAAPASETVLDSEQPAVEPAPEIDGNAPARAQDDEQAHAEGTPATIEAQAHDETPQGALPDPAEVSATSADQLREAATESADAAFEEAVNRSAFSEQDIAAIFALVTGRADGAHASAVETDHATEIVRLAVDLNWDSARLRQVLDALAGDEHYPSPQARVQVLLDYQRRALEQPQAA